MKLRASRIERMLAKVEATLVLVRRHPRLRRNVRKQPTLIRKYSPHASLRRYRKTESANPRYGEGFFSKLLGDFFSNRLRAIERDAGASG
jgi:hypothetical protein